MISKYLKNWLFDNQPIYEINLGDNKSDALAKIKDATLFGDDENGYYYDKYGYRFGFNSNKVDEIGIDFNHLEQDIHIENVGSINFKKAKIHEVLNFLNDNLIRWKAQEVNDTNYLYIELLKVRIILIFDIYEGRLTNITRSDLEFASR